ncbi:hypothetical protein ACHAW6_000630 [Cyclotella cf. meneghiniana]
MHIHFGKVLHQFQSKRTQISPNTTMCRPIQSFTSVRSVSTDCTSSRKGSLSLSNSDYSTTVSVPTFVEKRKEHIVLKNLTSSEIELLKTKDPFMYYSIPAARNAIMQGKDVVPSRLYVDVPSNSMASDKKHSTRQAPKRNNVTRLSRMSTECHPDLLLEEILCNPDLVAAMSRSSDLDDIEGCFLSLLLKMSH